MSPNAAHDNPAPPLVDGVHPRREAASKTKEPKPLFCCEPLPQHRQRKPSTRPQRKRKVVLPTTPAFTFDPKRSHVPSGKQDPSRPSTSESSASSNDEQTSPFPDHEIQDQYDAYRRCHTYSECPVAECSAALYPDTPCTDAGEMSPHNCFESPVSCDPALDSVEFSLQGIHPIYAFGHGYLQPPVAPQDYSYPVGPVQNYPTEPTADAHAGPVPHGIPAFPENNGYLYPPGILD